MDYKEALAYIEKIENKLGSDYSLRDVEELARRVGHPERSVKVVHIAGTNGKGSVGNYISNILAVSGYGDGNGISFVSGMECGYCHSGMWAWRPSGRY